MLFVGRTKAALRFVQSAVQFRSPTTFLAAPIVTLLPILMVAMMAVVVLVVVVVLFQPLPILSLSPFFLLTLRRQLEECCV